MWLCQAQFWAKDDPFDGNSDESIPESIGLSDFKEA
jgi:hypothetical protein